MRRYRWFLLMLSAAVSACTTPAPLSPTNTSSGDFGVIVMAHGGGREWDKAVLSAVEPLRKELPIEVAFGMADAASLQASVASLEARGVHRIGVVRLFVSGDSFFQRTEQILGFREGAPAKPPVGEHQHQHEHEGHDMALWKVATSSRFALSTQGLNEAPEMGAILLDRARSLSRDPAHEDVLILAHGPGDDAENQRWLTYMDQRAATVRTGLPFHRVQVATLREDWPEKRVEAERAVREFVATSRAEGRRTIVVPFRVEGFGPYAEVLQGLDYTANELGLLPHKNMTEWIRRQARELAAAPFAQAH